MVVPIHGPADLAMWQQQRSQHPGTYTVTVTSANGCTGIASITITQNTTPPATPAVGTITQPACGMPTGSVVLSGLPATGTWTLTRSPGGTTTGTGTTTTISGLPANATYTFTVTNDVGCVSVPSNSVVINAAPALPAAPAVGTITQPNCNRPTGSVVLNGLPASGTWTLTRMPGGNTTTEEVPQNDNRLICQYNVYLYSNQCSWLYIRFFR